MHVVIPPGHMVAFRGDYVHAGTSYDKDNTRIHLPLHVLDKTGTNTTHLEESGKLPPIDIAGIDGTNVDGAKVLGIKRTRRE